MTLLDALKVIRHIINAACREHPAPRNNREATFYKVLIQIKQILEEARINEN